MRLKEEEGRNSYGDGRGSRTALDVVDPKEAPPNRERTHKIKRKWERIPYKIFNNEGVGKKKEKLRQNEKQTSSRLMPPQVALYGPQTKEEAKI